MDLGEIVYCFSMLFSKLAIVLQIRRIFQGTYKGSVHWLSTILVTIIIMCYTAIILVDIVQCVPREKIWNTLVPGVCIDRYTLIAASGALNIGIDVFIFLLPIYAIWGLMLDPKRKLGIFAVFATGLL